MPSDVDHSDDVIIVNARIRTGDLRRPWADAALVRGDRVVAFGSSAEMRKLRVSRVLDAKGCVIETCEGRITTPLEC